MATTATTTTDLNIRDRASASGALLATIPKGGTATVTGAKSGTWLPVTYAGISGWVSATYVALATTPDPVKPSAALWTPDLRQILYDTAMDLLGKPYDWGGSNPIDGAESQEGMDCSGFTTVLLQSQDVLGETERLSAQSQYNRWKGSAVKREDLDLGDLIFYSSSKSTSAITHVMMALNSVLCIGAQGGGENTKTLADAVATDGYVRTRKIDYRGDRVAIVRPPWPFHEKGAPQ